MTSCGHGADVAAYVLGALPEDEHARFSAHLAGCDECARELAALQVVRDALGLGVAQQAPPPELEQRVMAVVRAEAELLRASGADADAPAPVTRAAQRRRRRRLPALRPLALAAAAVALLALGLGAGLLLADGEDARTLAAQVELAGAPGASAALELDGDRSRLSVRDFPPAAGGGVYQVWLKLPGREAPVSAQVLFVPGRDGAATVDLGRSLDGVDQVLVTPEPDGGSATPSTAPVVVATVS